MSDLQAFIELYKRFGIELTPRYYEDKIEIILAEDDYYDGNPSHALTEKITGYSGFYSSITFNLEGKFIEQGFWE